MSKAGSVSGIPGQLPLTGMMVTEPWHPGIGERFSKVGAASDGVNQSAYRSEHPALSILENRRRRHDFGNASGQVVGSM
jgi:hypothetical protein